jgi:hypothetical protein
MAGERRRALIAKMRLAKAQGRISLNLDAPERLKGSPSDLVLEDGDRLVIPSRPSQIQVIGAVYNANAFIYDASRTIAGYLGQAGGFTGGSDESEIYVLKVDGTAVSKRAEGWGFLSSKLDPGDTVVVPEELERIAWLREVKDLTQILYQIAVTAGVLIVVF